MRLGWIVLAALAAMSPAQSAEVQIVDGDSFAYNGENIRLWGIDTPDANQECRRGGKPWRPGPDAIAALREILARAEGMVCETRDIDRNGRKVATCRAQGKDIGTQMVESGWAWDYFEYSRGFYIYAESLAQKDKRGVWSGECAAPWRYRRSLRAPDKESPGLDGPMPRRQPSRDLDSPSATYRR